ncbi:MAG: histidine-type phosphatase [Capsulimonadaceae bacterium]
MFLILTGIVCSSGGPASAQAATDDSTLVFALVFSRHGVRAPTDSNDHYARYASQPWPDWPVQPNDLTPHGSQLMTLMGGYYRAYFIQQGLLSGNASTDAGSIYVYADNSERTLKTAEAMAAGLVPTGHVEVESMPDGQVDPLFYPHKGGLGQYSKNLAKAARLGRVGGDMSSVMPAYALQISLLGTVLGKPFDGTFDQAGTLAEILLLEYSNGFPASQIGWGRVTAAQIAQIDQLHAFGMELKNRNFYAARSDASNLLLHIGQTLEQAHAGQAEPHALGSTKDRLVVLVGHDGQISSMGGLLRADWQIPSFAWDDVPPSGAIVFELRRHKDDSDIVRVYYAAQTLDQMHDAAPLTLASGPAIVPIFIPGASTDTPTFDCPIDDFEKVVSGAVDQTFTN